MHDSCRRTLTIAPPPVGPERYIRAGRSDTTHSRHPAGPTLQPPFQHPHLADMKLSGILVLLTIFCLLGDSVDGRPSRRTCPGTEQLKKKCETRDDGSQVCWKECVPRPPGTCPDTQQLKQKCDTFGKVCWSECVDRPHPRTCTGTEQLKERCDTNDDGVKVCWKECV